MPEIGFDPTVLADLDNRTAQGYTSLNLPESDKTDSPTTFTRLKPKDNFEDSNVVAETYSIPQTEAQKASHNIGKETDEKMREQRRDLGRQLDEAQKALSQVQSNEQTSEVQAKINRLQSEINALDDEIVLARDAIIDIESARVRDEVTSVMSVEQQMADISLEVEESRGQLESIYQARREYQIKLNESKKKLFPHQKLYGWLRNQVGWSGAELDAVKVLEEQELAKIKQENPDVNDERARALYQTYLKRASTETEAKYQQDIADATARFTRAQGFLGEKQEKLKFAEGRLAEATDKLKVLIDKRSGLSNAKDSTQIQESELKGKSTRELKEAELVVGSAEQALRQAEEEEKKYWEDLKNELLADFNANEEDIKAEALSIEKQTKREKVRGLFAAPERDLLHLVHEIGLDIDGSVSIDTSIQDLSAITFQLLERYTVMDEAVKRFAGEGVKREDGRSEQGIVGEKVILLAHSMAIVENERLNAEREYQIAEYSKFRVLSESELETKLEAIDVSFYQNTEVGRLHDKLLDAQAWLKLPAHRTEGFKKNHKKDIKEKQALVVNLTSDFSAAERDIEVQKNAITTQNDRQKVKADRFIAEWKSTVLSDQMKRRKAEELRAADLFLGALSELTPEERKLATSGELNKAMMEAQAVFTNLLKWQSLLKGKASVAGYLAEAEVVQDRLVREAGDVVGKIGAELALSQVEFKMKRKKADREAVQSNIYRLTKELTEAQRRLSRANSERDASIMKAREGYLPAELASPDIEQSQELQFGTKRAVTDIRRLYTAVMYGSEAHVYDQDIPAAQVTERVGLHEQWVSDGREEFEGLVREKVAQTKEAERKRESKETEQTVSIEEALEQGAEAIRKAVYEDPEGFKKFLLDGGADRFVQSGGLRALVDGVANLTGDRGGLRKNIEAQNLAMRSIPNGETIHRAAIANNETILSFL